MMWWKARISDEQFTSAPDHLAAVIADLALLTQRVSRLEKSCELQEDATLTAQELDAWRRLQEDQ